MRQQSDGSDITRHQPTAGPLCLASCGHMTGGPGQTIQLEHKNKICYFLQKIKRF
jgi:hypothetical protein